MKYIGFFFACLSASFTLCHGLGLHEAVPEDGKLSGNGWGWNGQLPPGVETPPPCLDPSTITLETNVDSNFINRPRLFYYSGGSKFGMGLYAQAYLGRNPHSQQEFSEMCPAVFIVSPALRFVSGYGKMFQADCFSQDENTTTKCYRNNSPLTYDDGIDPSVGIQNKKYYLVKTDNKYYAIFLTCVNDRYADYQIVTTRPYVAPSEAAVFVDVIKAAKFSLSQSVLLSCQINKSYTHHYPYPFGNYPSSPSDYNDNSGNGHGWSQGQGSGGWHPAGPSNGWVPKYLS